MTKRCPDCGSRMRLLDMTWWICLTCWVIAMAQARVEKAQREREHGVEGAALVEAGQGTLLWT